MSAAGLWRSCALFLCPGHLPENSEVVTELLERRPRRTREEEPVPTREAQHAALDVDTWL